MRDSQLPDLFDDCDPFVEGETGPELEGLGTEQDALQSNGDLRKLLSFTIDESFDTVTKDFKSLENIVSDTPTNPQLLANVNDSTFDLAEISD